MTSDYGKDVYKQLMEVIARLDRIETDLKDEKSAYKIEKTILTSNSKGVE